MRFHVPLIPLLVVVLVTEQGPVQAQIASGGSPYSAYGFGDINYTGQVPSALMGGTGIAYTEPYGLLSANPASYTPALYQHGEGLQRPVFEGGSRGMFIKQRSAESTSRRSDAQFMGFNIGVPFGKGRTGMGFGIVPYSDVGYSISDKEEFEDGTVTYEYGGSGGLSRVFAGVGTILWQQKPDSAGDLGARLALGGNFEFLFGGVEQTRKAIYPAGQAYTNTSAYSSLVLRAPTGTFGFHFSDALTNKAGAERARERRVAKDQRRVERWKLEHVDTLRLSPDQRSMWTSARTDEARMVWLRSIGWKVAYTDSTRVPRNRTFQQAQPWRFTLGATTALPTVFQATSTDIITTYFRSSSGVETTIDTVPSNGKVEGTLEVPLGYGFGFSVYDTRWLFTAEVRSRDWSASTVDVEGYSLPSALRASMVYAAGIRFNPDDEGGVFDRATYRAGFRYTDDYLQVQGTPISVTSFTAGLSLPLNAVQTNSYFHFGAEYGGRGTTSNGLLREDFLYIWFGVSITPWKRERWFQQYQIQ